MAKQTTQDTLAMLDSFLKPVRARVQSEKNAADTASNKDTVTPDSLMKPAAGSTTQDNLGKEQSEEAKKGDSNVETAPANKDSNDKKPTDDQGPKRLTVDDKVTQLGTPDEQQITQKIASNISRADRLSNAILNTLMGQKHAEESVEEEAKREGESKEQEEEEKEEASEEEKEAAAAYNALLKEANDSALQYRDAYMFGRLKRAQDEAEIRAAGLTDAMCQAHGGIAGLLDKIAAEDPAAIMPEGIELGAGPEAGPEAGGEDQVAALAAALDEAGVTEEELAAAMQDVAALQEAGVTPEQIEAALGEIDAEEAAPEVAPVEAAPVAEEKVASVQRQILDNVKAVLRRTR